MSFAQHIRLVTVMSSVAVAAGLAAGVAQAAPHSEEFTSACTTALRMFNNPTDSMSKTHQLKFQLDDQLSPDPITGSAPSSGLVADRQAGVLTAYNTHNCNGPANTARPVLHSDGWYLTCETTLSRIDAMPGNKQQGLDTMIDQIHRGAIGHGDPDAEPGARAAFDHGNCN